MEKMKATSENEVTPSKSIETLEAELKQMSLERNKYKEAYETVVAQNSNLWALYSNISEYVVTQTQQRK